MNLARAVRVGLGLLAGAVSIPAALAESYPRDLFTVVELKFDSYREACGLDCMLRDRTAKDILVSVSSAIGIHPGYVRLALDAAYPTSQVNGEETNYRLPFPTDYKYCSAKVYLVSVMSASDDPARGTAVTVAIDSRELGVYTWTGNPRPGEGQSSAEGYALVTLIKPEYLAEFRQKGVSTDAPTSGNRVLLQCRGASCGQQTQDGRIDRAGSTTPELKKPPAGF